MKRDIQLKVAIVGESGTGKTSLAARFVNDIFKENVARTVVVDSFKKTIIVGGKKVTLLIWDTGRLCGYKVYVQDYIKKADGVILVFDVTNRDSFMSLNEWLRDVREMNRDSAMLIVGNKIDKLCPKQVSRSELRSFANSHGIAAIEVSAKSGDDVEKVFQRLSFSMVCEKVHRSDHEDDSGNATKNRPEQLPLTDSIRDFRKEKTAQKFASGLSIQSVLPDRKIFNFRLPFFMKIFIYLCITTLLVYYFYHLLTYTFGEFNWDLIQFMKRAKSVWHQVCDGSQLCDRILSSLMISL